MTKLIVGCGYLGGRVARLWREQGHSVVAVTRHAEQAEALARQGLQTFVADVTRPETLAGLPMAETVLFAVGYDPRGGRSRREVYVDGLRNVLDALPPGTKRFLFISSTGVYGDAGGQWVDEDWPCRPTSDAGRAMLAAEEVLQSHHLGPQGIVLRLAGLYGPGRLPSVNSLRSDAATAVAAQRVVNLIHVDDAAAVVLAAERRAPPPRTYLVSDGHPVPRRTYLAEISGLPPPRLVDPAATDAATATAPRRRGGDKRVRNARMLAELGVELAYPTYREGLAAAVEASDSGAA
jgi:nucleoside-diphosphate-sugar epimerase